jgi:hypothetical protein
VSLEKFQPIGKFRLKEIDGWVETVHLQISCAPRGRRKLDYITSKILQTKFSFNSIADVRQQVSYPIVFVVILCGYPHKIFQKNILIIAMLEILPVSGYIVAMVSQPIPRPHDRPGGWSRRFRTAPCAVPRARA